MKAIKRWMMIGGLAVALGLGSCSTGTGVAGGEDYYSDAPGWAPYSAEARYYYFPDLGTYYDVRSSQFVYWDGFNWSYATRAPYGYTPYDLGNTYIVVLDRDVQDPWMHHNYYSSMYPKGYYYGPRNMGHARGIYPYRGYNENNNSPIIPGDQPAIDPSTPTRPRNLNDGSMPGRSNTPRSYDAPSTQPGRQSPNIQQSPSQTQPRMQQAPQQQRTQPSPQQRTQPSPRVGQPRGGH